MKYSSLFKLVGGPANGTHVKVRSDERGVFPDRYEFAEYPDLSVLKLEFGDKAVESAIKSMYIISGRKVHTYTKNLFSNDVQGRI